MGSTARLDLSDSALKDAVLKVRSDASPETFCVLGYEGKAKIVLKDSGSGDPYACIDDMGDGDVSYALLRVGNTRDQESKTVKFVFLCFVGPSVGGMQKGRVGSHKGDVKELIGQSHVEIQTDDKEDISQEAITTKLKKASGANYDLGSNAGGDYKSAAGDIGKSAAAKYRALEKESNIGPVVFNTGPAPPRDYVTPVDLGGRPMVAPPSQAKKNTVIRDETVKTQNDAVTEREIQAGRDAATKTGKAAAPTTTAASAPTPPPPAPVAPSPPEPAAEPESEPEPEPVAALAEELVAAEIAPPAAEAEDEEPAAQ